MLSSLFWKLTRPFLHPEKTGNKFLIINSLSVIRCFPICINLFRMMMEGKATEALGREKGILSPEKGVELNLLSRKRNIHNWKVFLARGFAVLFLFIFPSFDEKFYSVLPLVTIWGYLNSKEIGTELSAWKKHKKIVSHCDEKKGRKKFNLKFLIRAEISEAYFGFFVLQFILACILFQVFLLLLTRKCTIGMMSYHLVQRALQSYINLNLIWRKYKI